MDTHPKHLPADERRAVTVESVVALAGSQNPSEITTAAIAKHMNLTQGALFRHFPNKEAIWQAVMEWVAERLLARIDRSAQGIESPLAAMEAMFMSHIEFVAEHPGVPRMMFGELQRAESTPAIGSECCAGCLTRHQSRGPPVFPGPSQCLRGPNPRRCWRRRPGTVAGRWRCQAATGSGCVHFPGPG